jgi:hypothetical protein
MTKYVNMTDDLAEVIDKTVESAKDTIGTPRWRSRADFVEEACKTLLKQTKAGKQ